MSIFSDDQDVIDLRRGNKYFDIARELKRRIDEGEIATRLPSLPQMCQEFETTPVTAHKAVGLLKREGLVRSIKGKGTFVTRLQRTKTGVIEGVFSSAKGGLLHDALIQGFQMECAKQNLRAMVTGHEGDPAKALSLVQEAWENHLVDGFVLWPVGGKRKSLAVDYLQQENIPFVLAPEVELGTYADCHRVVNDQLTVAESLVAHLVQKGHQKIAFFIDAGLPKTVYTTLRFEAYKHIMQQSGLKPLPPVYFHMNAARDVENRKLMTQSVGGGVTAAFCVTDALALSVCRVCLDLGIRIPGQLTLAGYDNGNESKVLGFSTVDQRFDEIGRQAVGLLTRELAGELTEPTCLTVHAKAIIR